MSHISTFTLPVASRYVLITMHQIDPSTHLIQRPCYQRGSPCQDPEGNRTTRRPPDHRKETQTAVVWSCFPFIRSGQNLLARHSEREKKRTKEEVGRQHQGMDRPDVQQVPEGSGEQGKMEKTGCKIICGAPTTLAVKGLMMMMIDDDDGVKRAHAGFSPE